MINIRVSNPGSASTCVFGVVFLNIGPYRSGVVPDILIIDVMVALLIFQPCDYEL